MPPPNRRCSLPLPVQSGCCFDQLPVLALADLLFTRFGAAFGLDGAASVDVLASGEICTGRPRASANCFERSNARPPGGGGEVAGPLDFGLRVGISRGCGNGREPESISRSP